MFNVNARTAILISATAVGFELMGFGVGVCWEKRK